MTRKGVLFVVIQFCAIIILLGFTRFKLFQWASIFQLSSVLIGIWAAWELKRSRLSVFPEVKGGAKLIQSGPYRLIRHPLYAAVLLFFIPTITERFELAAVFLVLLINLLMKMKYEEELLKSHFSDYEQYMKKSYYIIPFFY